MFSEHYKLLSIIFGYPEDERVLKESCEKLVKISGGIYELDEFAEFIENSSLPQIQEGYVSSFELQPLCVPYIAHHIFGESYRKGEYMVFLKDIYRRNSFVPSINELPDHIAVVSEFLSVLKNGRREFLSAIMPGVEKMVDSIEGKEFPYRQAVLLFHRLCSDEFSKFEEVIECSTC